MNFFLESYFFLRTLGLLGTRIKERNQTAPESQNAGPSSGLSKISTRVELGPTRGKIS